MDADGPTAAELRAIPAGRDILSFRLALDRSGRFANLKTLTADGRQECLVLAAPIALYIRDCLRAALRARPGLEALPTDDTFFRRQPRHEAGDWTTASGHVGVPIGAHVHTEREGCILAFPLDREGCWTAFRMRPLHAAYFLHAINDAEANEDFGRRPGAGAVEPPLSVN